MIKASIWLLLLVCGVKADYFVGAQGESCSQTCYQQGMNCNPHIVTDNSPQIFSQLGISCTPDNTSWWAEDQPSYVSDPKDGNYGKCLGFNNVPGGVLCAGRYPTVQRICRCDAPSTKYTTFGTGLSSGGISQTEQFVFEHFVAPGDVGVMTHLWLTYPSSVDNGVVVRYYVDGETTASIEFQPSLACGVGFYDRQAPWGTKWFGKGAADGAWFWNFRVPFQKSIMVSVQHLYGSYGGFYMIVRGGTNLPIQIGGITVPTSARLNLFTTQSTVQPLDFVPLVNISSGSGLHFMHTLAVQSGDMNFLEGCFHMYTNDQSDFPGIVLSTGTEDYFDSAWYFNPGEFHFPVSGFTHFNQTGNVVTWSAYRFHEMDPLYFTNGFQFVWRNGDMNDPAGMKCMTQSGGSIVGSPTASTVLAYAWVYTW